MLTVAMQTLLDAGPAAVLLALLPILMLVVGVTVSDAHGSSIRWQSRIVGTAALRAPRWPNVPAATAGAWR